MIKGINTLLKKSAKSVSSVGNKILYSRFALYFFCVFAILDIYSYAMFKNYNSIIVFIIVGYLTSLFSKNMVVVLATAIIITHLLTRSSFVLQNSLLKEGAANMDDKEDNEEEDNEEEEEDNKEGDKSSKKIPKVRTKDSDMAELDKISEAAIKNSIKDTDMALKDIDVDKLPEETKEQMKTYDKLKVDFTEFQDIQQKILTGMQEIDPLLTRAEGFIEKFEKYGKEIERK